MMPAVVSAIAWTRWPRDVAGVLTPGARGKRASHIDLHAFINAHGSFPDAGVPVKFFAAEEG